MRTILGATATLTLIMILTSCGSSSGGAGSAKSSESGGSSGGSSGASVPAVGSATDLHKAPVPSAGSNPSPTQLITKDLVVGTGTQAGTTGTVEVQYVGANYADGKVFDSSWERGQSASFPLTGVIKGFAQGITGMKVGGRREIVIPPNLGYGLAGAPPAVGPNETLVFVVDLLAVK